MLVWSSLFRDYLVCLDSMVTDMHIRPNNMTYIKHLELGTYHLMQWYCPTQQSPYQERLPPRKDGSRTHLNYFQLEKCETQSYLFHWNSTCGAKFLLNFSHIVVTLLTLKLYHSCFRE